MQKFYFTRNWIDQYPIMSFFCSHGQGVIHERLVFFA
jgi:hypothetical protein